MQLAYLKDSDWYDVNIHRHPASYKVVQQKNLSIA